MAGLVIGFMFAVIQLIIFLVIKSGVLIFIGWLLILDYVIMRYFDFTMDDYNGWLGNIWIVLGLIIWGASIVYRIVRYVKRVVSGNGGPEGE